MRALLRDGPFAGEEEIEAAVQIVAFPDAEESAVRHEYELHPDSTAERAIYVYVGPADSASPLDD